MCFGKAGRLGTIIPFQQFTGFSTGIRTAMRTCEFNGQRQVLPAVLDEELLSRRLHDAHKTGIPTPIPPEAIRNADVHSIPPANRTILSKSFSPRAPGVS